MFDERKSQARVRERPVVARESCDEAKKTRVTEATVWTGEELRYLTGD